MALTDSLCLIELSQQTTETLIGVHLHGADLLQDAIYPYYVHGEVIMRENRCRYVDGEYQSGYVGYGVQANGVERLILRDEMLELADANLLRNNHCGQVTFFENRTLNGELLALENPTTGNFKEELGQPVEDNFILANLTK